MHRRGIWRRSSRRRTDQEAHHQASKAADHIRRLSQNERQGRTTQNPIGRGQDGRGEAQEVWKLTHVRQKVRCRDRVVYHGHLCRPYQPRLFL